MKGRIYITYFGMTEAEACGYANVAMNVDNDRTGVVKFSDGTMLPYSDDTRWPSITVWREKE